MFLFVLGILDLIAGIILGLSGFVPYTENGFVFFLGLIIVIKGIVSFLMGAAKGFYLDFMGLLDIVAGAMLMIATTGFMLFFFPYIGIILIFKGLYSMLIGLVKK